MSSIKVRSRSLLLLLLFWMINASAALDDNEQAMVSWIDAHWEDAISLLEKTVNISSGTLNIEGVEKVGVVMRAELDALGLETEWIDLPPEMQRAGHLVGRNSGSGGRKFLLIGHLDTVFEADDTFQAFRREGNIGYGPGVDDMKSGNVVIVYALQALQHIGVLESLPVVVFYTGEEEKSGKPLSVSRKDLIEAGQWADISLGFESAHSATAGTGPPLRGEVQLAGASKSRAGKHTHPIFFPTMLAQAPYSRQREFFLHSMTRCVARSF